MPPCRFRFPDPRGADEDGLVASGGDLEPATLLAAYRGGIFPWPAEGIDLLWWSPDPRAVLPPDGVHVSRSLRRTLRQARFRVTIDAAFDDVIDACADRGGEGTWITPALRAAYARLHRLGWAHSVEVWAGGALVGGLYGVASGGLFAAESMFHRVHDASKVALVALGQHAGAVGVTLIDVQLPSPHLESMGAVTLARADYLDALALALARPVNFTGGAAVSPVE
ncbi:MAG TPA: leucyl/phenylalanyl-tRNA--protein transferase [Methylomirabilota bacterium]|nr:leucyl/phenylalanyl-tRNA--protein transferase [Methylomirabilota bacterium]